MPAKGQQKRQPPSRQASDAQDPPLSRRGRVSSNSGVDQQPSQPRLCGLCGTTAVSASHQDGPLDQCKLHGEFFNDCKGLTWQNVCKAYTHGSREIDAAIRAEMNGGPLSFVPETVSMKSNSFFQVYQKFQLLTDKNIHDESEGLDAKPQLMSNIPKLSLSSIRGINDGDYWAFPKFGPTKYPVLKVGTGNEGELSMELIEPSQIKFAGHGRAVMDVSEDARLDRVGFNDLGTINCTVTLADFRDRAMKKHANLEEKRRTKNQEQPEQEGQPIAFDSLLQQMGGSSRPAMAPKRPHSRPVSMPVLRRSGASMDLEDQPRAPPSIAPSTPRPMHSPSPNTFPHDDAMSDSGGQASTILEASGCTTPGVLGSDADANIESMDDDAVVDYYCTPSLLPAAMIKGKQGVCRYGFYRTAKAIARKGRQVASNRIKTFADDHLEIEKLSPHDAHKHSAASLRDAIHVAKVYKLDIPEDVYERIIVTDLHELRLKKVWASHDMDVFIRRSTAWSAEKPSLSEDITGLGTALLSESVRFHRFRREVITKTLCAKILRGPTERAFVKEFCEQYLACCTRLAATGIELTITEANALEDFLDACRGTLAIGDLTLARNEDYSQSLLRMLETVASDGSYVGDVVGAMAEAPEWKTALAALKLNRVGFKESLDRVVAARDELEAMMDDEGKPFLPTDMSGIIQCVEAIEQSMTAISYCLGAKCEFFSGDLKNLSISMIVVLPSMFTADIVASTEHVETHLKHTDRCLQEATIVLPLEKLASDARAAFSVILQTNKACEASALLIQTADALIKEVSVQTFADFSAKVHQFRGAKLLPAAREALKGIDALRALLDHSSRVFPAYGPCENLFTFTEDVLRLCHSDPSKQLSAVTSYIKAIQCGCTVYAQTVSNGNVESSVPTPWSDEERVGDLDQKCQDLKLLIDGMTAATTVGTGHLLWDSAASLSSAAVELHEKTLSTLSVAKAKIITIREDAANTKITALDRAKYGTVDGENWATGLKSRPSMAAFNDHVNGKLGASEIAAGLKDLITDALNTHDAYAGTCTNLRVVGDGSLKTKLKLAAETAMNTYITGHIVDIITNVPEKQAKRQLVASDLKLLKLIDVPEEESFFHKALLDQIKKIRAFA